VLTPLPTQQQQTAADGPAEHSLHRATPKLSVRGGAAPNLAAAAGRHSAAQRRPADLGRLTLTLDLIGGPCAGSVEVVTDGLAGKSRWLRKAPLELAHAARPLLAGRRAVLLFAGGSAAKEQWHCALARGAAGAGPDPDAGPEAKAAGRTGAVGAAAASVEALYAAFCVHARDVAAVPYPQVRCRTLLPWFWADKACLKVHKKKISGIMRQIPAVPFSAEVLGLRRFAHSAGPSCSPSGYEVSVAVPPAGGRRGRVARGGGRRRRQLAAAAAALGPPLGRARRGEGRRQAAARAPWAHAPRPGRCFLCAPARCSDAPQAVR